MSNDFHSTLKLLSKQAKKEAEIREKEAEEVRKRAEQEVNFAKEMADVKPIKHTNRYQAPRDHSPIKLRQHDEQLADTDGYFYIGDGYSDEPPASFSKNGQGKNDIQRLQNEHWPVKADVDLHGYTQEEAQQVLNEFIQFLAKRGVCGEIIHGSGLRSSGYKPVLKNMVRRWLMEHPDVIAYAEPHKGNDGAVRILIKRPRPKTEFEY